MTTSTRNAVRDRDPADEREYGRATAAKQAEQRIGAGAVGQHGRSCHEDIERDARSDGAEDAPRYGPPRVFHFFSEIGQIFETDEGEESEECAGHDALPTRHIDRDHAVGMILGGVHEVGRGGGEQSCDLDGTEGGREPTLAPTPAMATRRS